MNPVDLGSAGALAERLEPGLPLPRRRGGGLVAEVAWPDQLRRHVSADQGRASYATLGWHVLAPYSTAVRPAA